MNNLTFRVFCAILYINGRKRKVAKPTFHIISSCNTLSESIVKRFSVTERRVNPMYSIWDGDRQHPLFQKITSIDGTLELITRYRIPDKDIAALFDIVCMYKNESPYECDINGWPIKTNNTIFFKDCHIISYNYNHNIYDCSIVIRSIAYSTDEATQVQPTKIIDIEMLNDLMLELTNENREVVHANC